MNTQILGGNWYGDEFEKKPKLVRLIILTSDLLFKVLLFGRSNTSLKSSLMSFNIIGIFLRVKRKKNEK